MKRVLFVALIISLNTIAFAQQDSSRKPTEDLNIDYMLRGYFCASSLIEDQRALGGFGTSRNLPKAVEQGKSFPQGKISLVARPDVETIFAGKYKGLTVLLVNMTSQQVAFHAQDSRLDITQEALDTDFKWKPVEYLPSSWCGNSYHRVILGPREYWSFAAARFTGRLKTKFRFRLDHQTSNGQKLTIYSNEFEGSLNKGQFKNQRDYKPSGIMDPYIN
jgi:hypothetical protein